MCLWDPLHNWNGLSSLSPGAASLWLKKKGKQTLSGTALYSLRHKWNGQADEIPPAIPGNLDYNWDLHLVSGRASPRNHPGVWVRPLISSDTLGALPEMQPKIPGKALLIPCIFPLFSVWGCSHHKPQLWYHRNLFLCALLPDFWSRSVPHIFH